MAYLPMSFLIIKFARPRQASKGGARQTLHSPQAHNALPRADLDTAPGPDDLPCQFYRNFWPQVGRLLFKALRHSLRCGQLLRGMTESVVRRIPKAAHYSKHISSWCPFTLLNSSLFCF